MLGLQPHRVSRVGRDHDGGGEIEIRRATFPETQPPVQARVLYRRDDELDRVRNERPARAQEPLAHVLRELKDARLEAEPPI